MQFIYCESGNWCQSLCTTSCNPYVGDSKVFGKKERIFKECAEKHYVNS